MATDFARMVMSYHPTILAHFSRTALEALFYFSWRNVSIQKDGTRMALLCETEGQDGNRMAKL